jgi:hypothetical protein
MEGLGFRNIAATALVAALFCYLFFGPDPMVFFVLGAVAVSAGIIKGRRPIARPGLVVTAVLNAFALLVLDGFLQLAFSFSCGSDTSTPDPGSDLAGYCDTLRAHDELSWLIVFGPPLFALLFGLSGAQRQEPNRVLVGVLGGLALVIAAQLPGWVAAS